ncbi:MAG: hypothetical protein C0425_00130 [Chlorobiaceae bacterium]|nr:hypothetical protein [Chlorobiaceae bacterium]MBA4308730.1 hypothetical protein [Chlorobiaceae bacterium]
MKKNCLIKSLIASTIFFTIIFYVAMNKGNEWVVKPVKHFFINQGISESKLLVTELPATPERDSLVLYLEKYLNHLSNSINISLNEIGSVADTITSITKDKIIDTNEVKSFKELTNNLMKNERQ